MSPDAPRSLPDRTTAGAAATSAAYHALLEAVTEQVWRCDAQGSDLTPLLARLHADDRAAAQAAVQQALSRGDPFAVRARGHLGNGPFGNGEVGWLELRAVAVRDDGGAIREWLGATVDVQCQIQAAADAAPRERLQLALTASRLGIWDWDLVAQRVQWSPECHAIFGVGEFDGTATTFEQLVHPADRAVDAARRNHAIATGSDYASEYRVRTANGVDRWVASRARVLLDGDGKASRLVGTVQDIDDRKLAEAIARDCQARLRLAIDAAPMSAWSVEPRTRQIEAIAGSLPWAPAPATTRQPLALAEATVHPEDRDRFRAAFDCSLATGAPLELACRRRDTDGTARWTVSYGSFAAGPDGRRRLFGITLDCTERVGVELATRGPAANLDHTSAPLRPAVRFDADTTAPPGGRERVLLVEDDEAVRRLVESTLQGLGYDAVVASEGPGALAQFTAAGGAIRLLLIDANLPGMTGHQVAAALRRQSPGLGVIIMSGDVDAPSRHRDGDLEPVEYLPKPFLVAELSARLRHLLAADRPARRTTD